MFDLTQLGILALTGTGIWLVGRPESWRRIGYILGLSAQPVWLYMSIKSELWGVAILTLFCTYGWAQGVWFHWFRSERVLPETPTQVTQPRAAHAIEKPTHEEIAGRTAVSRA